MSTPRCTHCALWRYLAERAETPHLAVKFDPRRDRNLRKPIRRRPVVPDTPVIDWDARRPATLVQVYADLGSIREVAAVLGVPTTRMRRWIERRPTTNCPTPARKLLKIDVYSITEWVGWYELWKATRGPEAWAARRATKQERSPW